MRRKTVSNWQADDPLRAQEIAKYGQSALPSRTYLLDFLKKYKKPLTAQHIASIFALDAEQTVFLQHRLKAMTSAGQLLCNREGRFGVVSKMDLWKGRVVAHPEGYGFLQLEADEADGFIAPKYMHGLMHGDEILARIKHIDAAGRKDYAPVEILQRGQKRIVGKVLQKQGIWFLQPDNRRLLQTVIVPANALFGAREGEIVVAEITAYPDRQPQVMAKVTKVLGNQLQAGMEVEIALENYAIPHHFPQEVMAQVNDLDDELSEKEYESRQDLRALPFVTIDGIASRDFDDAVYAKKSGANYRLYVAIADVGHYVRRGSALDEEAYLRATSVYFPDRVIPMLPEKLSNGLCSLNPQVDRLAMVCELSIDAAGMIKRSKFYEAVIHSHCRLTYETVEQLLFVQNDAMREAFTHLLPALEALKEVYRRLRIARENRQAIDFEFDEAEFSYDSEGKIESITARKRLQAHRLIEECMIAANVAAAKFVEKHKFAAPYRVHDRPDSDKAARLLEYLGKLNLSWQGVYGQIEPADLAALVTKIAAREDREVIEKMILRTLPQAVYSPENRGHFGLALSHYAHFTSPIRRYPDLLLHRAIKHKLQGKTAKTFFYDYQAMQTLSAHCSMAERRADEATREAMDFLKCEFMRHRLGEVLTGKISSVVSFGLFVTLEEFFIDGLVHIASLASDYYHYDASALALVGERSGRVYRVGETVRVRVAKVSLDERKIDFELLDEKRTTASKRRRAVDKGRGKSTQAKGASRVKKSDAYQDAKKSSAKTKRRKS